MVFRRIRIWMPTIDHAQSLAMEEQTEIVTVHVVQFCSLVRILVGKDTKQSYPDEYHSLSGCSKKRLLAWTKLRILGLFYIDVEMSLT